MSRSGRPSRSGSGTRPASARRTASSGNGPGAERGRASPPDQRCESAYLFGAICPARGVGAALAMPFADTNAMQIHLDEIARTGQGRACGPAVPPRRMAHHWQTRRARKHLPDLPALSRPGTEPGRKCLAVPARQLALQPRLRHLRRHYRCCLRRMEPPRRIANDHHLNRNAKVGSDRSLRRAAGITGPEPAPGQTGRLGLEAGSPGAERASRWCPAARRRRSAR